MSHFYGSIPQSARRTNPTARAHKTGLTVRAASWQGAIEVTLEYDDASKTDRFTVRQTHHQNHGCREIIAEGVVGAPSRAANGEAE